MKPRHLKMYMDIAETVSKQSSAIKLQVGAVAVKMIGSSV
jgi:deoxycytidylate deaminase